MNTADLQDPEYLGDGVYVGHDGYHVVLWIQSGSFFGIGAIALEPGVRARFNAYCDRLMEAAV